MGKPAIKSHGNICIAITSRDAAEARRVSRKAEIAEVRLDLCRFSLTDVRRVFRQGRRLIATCRPGVYRDDERGLLLNEAIEAGAGFVDIEVEASGALHRAISAAARRHRCKVIVSYHNFDRTPQTATLKRLIGRCFRKGADIAKIACTVRGSEDSLRLLSLLQCERKLIVTGMGSFSEVTRVAAPLLGGFLTYASLGKGRESASGQIELERLRRIFALIKGC